MAERKVKAWITLKGGKHIPIFEGESKENVKNRLKEGAKKDKVPADFNFDTGLIKGQKNAGSNKELTADSLRKNKGIGEYNGYKIEIGKNENGSFGKRTMVMDPKTLKSKVYNSPEKAIEAAKKGNLFKDKTSKIAHEHIINENNHKATEKSWQDKDAEVKAKQMAEADVQKEERSEKYKRPMTEQHRNPSITADADSFKDKTPDSMQGKNHHELRNKLKSELGLVVDEEFEGKVNDGAQVVMYKKQWDGSIKERYVGTYHWLPNGEKQITDIKVEPELKEVKFGKNKYKVDKNGYTAIEKPKTNKPVNVAKVFNTALGSPDKQTVKDTIQELTQLQEKDPSVTPYINQLQEHLRYLSRHDYKGGDV